MEGAIALLLILSISEVGRNPGSHGFSKEKGIYIHIC